MSANSEAAKASLGGAVAVREELEHALARGAQHRRQGEEFGLPGPQCAEILTGAGAVSFGARGGDTDGAGFEALLEQTGHFAELLLVGMLTGVRPALPHDKGAESGVRKVRPDIDRARLALQGVEVFGERLPIPAQALVQRGARDVLDAFHHGDQPVVAVRGHRREPDPAVAHGHRRHAVMRRRGQQRIPGGLAVVVGVGVDEPRGHQQAIGIELATALGDVVTDCDDPLPLDGDIGPTRRSARPVDHRAVSDDQISAHCFTSIQAPNAQRRIDLRASDSSSYCVSVNVMPAAAQFSSRCSSGRRPGYGDHDRGTAEEPGQADLGDGGAELLRHRVERAAGPGEVTAGQWEPRDEADLVLLGVVDDVFAAPVTEVVLILHADDRHDPLRRLDLIHPDLGEADFADLALLTQRAQQPELLVRGNLGVDPVQLEEVDLIHPETGQAPFALLTEVLGTPVGRPLVRAGTGETGLGRDLQRGRVGVKGVMDELLRHIRSVRVRRVDQVHAQLDGAPQDAEREIAIPRGPPHAAPWKLHRPKTEPVHSQRA